MSRIPMHQATFRAWGNAEKEGLKYLKEHQIKTLERYGVIQEGKLNHCPAHHLDLFDFKLLKVIKLREGQTREYYYLRQGFCYSVFHQKFAAMVASGLITTHGKSESTRGPKPNRYALSREGTKSIVEWHPIYARIETC
jgi:hypothetical protein